MNWTKMGINWSKWFSKQGNMVGKSAVKSTRKAIDK